MWKVRCSEVRFSMLLFSLTIYNLSGNLRPFIDKGLSTRSTLRDERKVSGNRLNPELWLNVVMKDSLLWRIQGFKENIITNITSFTKITYKRKRSVTVTHALCMLVCSFDNKDCPGVKRNACPGVKMPLSENALAQLPWSENGRAY